MSAMIDALTSVFKPRKAALSVVHTETDETATDAMREVRSALAATRAVAEETERHVHDVECEAHDASTKLTAKRAQRTDDGGAIGGCGSPRVPVRRSRVHDPPRSRRRLRLAGRVGRSHVRSARSRGGRTDAEHAGPVRARRGAARADPRDAGEAGADTVVGDGARRLAGVSLVSRAAGGRAGAHCTGQRGGEGAAGGRQEATVCRRDVRERASANAVRAGELPGTESAIAECGARGEACPKTAREWLSWAFTHGEPLPHEPEPPHTVGIVEGPVGRRT